MSDRLTSPAISLIVPTFGRTRQLSRLLDSLDRQTFRDFEVIISDQNPPGYLDEVLAAPRGFPLIHLNRPDERGISRARNAGWHVTKAPVVMFPDDDAWYPATFLEDGLEKMSARGADLLAGRSVDETGRAINGRFAKTARPITRGGVWIMQIEWTTLIRRDVLDRLGGYDEALGIGCQTPWQAAEGPDLILRALEQGFSCHYDPDLAGHHEEYETNPPSPEMTAKARAYARGMGFVLRKNGAGPVLGAYWAARPLMQLLVNGVQGKGRRARYFALVSLGRLEGWLQRPVLAESPEHAFDGRTKRPAESPAART